LTIVVSNEYHHDMAAQAVRHLEEEVSIAIIRKADALMQVLTDLLKPHGLSSTQYNVLRILRGAGREGASSKEISSKLIARDPDVTRLMDRLEKRGLLTRDRAKEDRRVVTHQLTPEGLAMLGALDEPIQNIHRTAMDGVNAANLETLLSILEEIRIES
jgi:DNA-binding MarR family transcriptional regulator